MHDGEPLRHLMGCSTFAEATVMSEIVLATVNPQAQTAGLRMSLLILARLVDMGAWPEIIGMSTSALNVRRTTRSYWTSG